jgi:hypothetical protein
VLAPALMYTDDVSLAEDLSPGVSAFLLSCFFLLAFSLYSVQPSEGLSRPSCIGIACGSAISTSAQVRASQDDGILRLLTWDAAACRNVLEEADRQPLMEDDLQAARRWAPTQVSSS